MEKQKTAKQFVGAKIVAKLLILILLILTLPIINSGHRTCVNAVTKQNSVSVNPSA